MNPITYSQFIIDFPEFADAAKFPASSVNYWLAVANAFLGPCATQWGGQNSTLYNLGVELYVAHNVLLEYQAALTSAAGGFPGLARGVISGETPGSVSLSYDTASASVEGAGDWNLTVYGTRYQNLIQIIGVGVLYVGAGSCAPGGLSTGTGQAWSGPNCLPGVFS